MELYCGVVGKLVVYRFCRFLGGLTGLWRHSNRVCGDEPYLGVSAQSSVPFCCILTFNLCYNPTFTVSIA